MKSRRGPAALLAVVLLALAGAALGPATSAGAAPAKAATTTTVPAGKWDPRIEPIAKEVAKLRKLGFEHPVPVEFLPSKEFDKQVTVDAGKLTKKNKAAIAHQTARLAAIGLVPHTADLVQQQNDLQSSGVLALYLPSKKKVLVRGDALDSPAKKVTVAHELTHALQDQHFDLQKLGKEADKTHSVDAYKALVEGDAVRVQDLYKKRLSQADQDQADQENNAGATKAQDAAASADVAPALNVFQQAPYQFGPLMLQTVKAANGESAIDDLFRNVPTNDLSYVLPTSLLDKTKIATVAAPKAGKGEKQNGKADTFGSFALYLVLSQQLSPADALRIVDGWGGDAMIDYTRGTGDTKEQCVGAAFAGQNADDAKAIQQGLEQWAAAQPAGSAAVTASDGKVQLSSCDVAAPRAAPAHDAMYAFVLAITRNQLLSSYLEQGAPRNVAQCAADGVVRDETVQPILEQSAKDPGAEPGADTIATLRSRVQDIVTSCVRTGKPGSTA
jgi:hypothetical protein